MHCHRCLLPFAGIMTALLAGAGCGSNTTSTPQAAPAAAPTTPPSSPAPPASTPAGATSSGGGSSDYLSIVARARTRANEIESVNNLKQIALSLHVYHDANNVFPTDNPKGSLHPGLSWRVALLPYIEQQALYQQFKLDEPWDSPNNKKLLDKMPGIFRDPRFQRKEDKPTTSYYRGFTGEGTIFGTAGGATLGAITNVNGSSNTFMVVEAGDAVPWTKPDELVYDAQKPLPTFGGPPRDNFYAAFADGHVQKIPAKIDEKTLRCMIQWTNQKPFKLP